MNLTMFETIFATCLGVAAPIITIYVICKLWNCVFQKNTSDWYSNWEDFIWLGKNKPLRKATKEERAHQLTTGKHL